MRYIQNHDEVFINTNEGSLVLYELIVKVLESQRTISKLKTYTTELDNRMGQTG